jgi:threonine dehydratase
VAFAIATLMERAKIVSEGAGAAGVAAALASKLPLNPNCPTVFVMCGGNIDMNMVSNILQRGLTRAQRWLKLEVTVEDKPGELARLTKEIGDLRANVLEIQHDRISPSCPVGHTLIRFQLETSGPTHAKALLDRLVSLGYSVGRS